VNGISSVHMSLRSCLLSVILPVLQLTKVYVVETSRFCTADLCYMRIRLKAEYYHIIASERNNESLLYHVFKKILILHLFCVIVVNVRTLPMLLTVFTCFLSSPVCG
jgi:hypothetical protein